MTEAQKIARAERKVRAMTGFYIHLIVFAVVMLVMFALNFTDDSWWVQYPFLFWGAGVIAHWWAVFGEGAERLARWQLKKIYELKSHME
jgi:hypothetical protein